MIAEYESDEQDFLLGAPRQYALTQEHKHLREMTKISGLVNAPIFTPIVSDFYSGMTVTVPLFKNQLLGNKTSGDIKALYSQLYNGKIVTYCEDLANNSFISAHELSGKDTMKITVGGNDDRIILIACYDNLGKGASGAAIESMNMILGVDRTNGLVL